MPACRDCGVLFRRAPRRRRQRCCMDCINKKERKRKLERALEKGGSYWCWKCKGRHYKIAGDMFDAHLLFLKWN